MTWRQVGAFFFGVAFTLFNALTLFLAGSWLQFAQYGPLVLTDGEFSIPGSIRVAGSSTITANFYHLLPHLIAGLLLISSACLFAHVRLAK